MVIERLGPFIERVTDKLFDTKEGGALFFEVGGQQPQLSVNTQSSINGHAQAPMAFQYPNTVEIAAGAFPEDGVNALPFDEDARVEGAFALSYIHELAHRRQSTKPGIQSFFEGRLHPMQAMHAELLIEAENYARTAQLAWRIAHDSDNPYSEISDYMLAASPDKHTESSYAVYAQYMNGKEITEETEKEAMKQVVNDFFFNSKNAQRYLWSRLTQIHTFLESQRLQQMVAQDSVLARDWMKTQPQIAGMGPDAAADYKVSNIMALGETSTGSIFEIGEGFNDKLADPNVIIPFLGDDGVEKLCAIISGVSAVHEVFGTQPAVSLP